MAGQRASIFLIGPMGAGKTSIGRRLAAATGRAFRDSDRALSERTGVSVAEIFEREGEAGFRRRERELLEALTREPEIVLATGGGAVLRLDNRCLLRRHGVVVHLDAAADVLLGRLGRDRRRPLLQGEDVADRIAALLAERQPLYQAAAHFAVVADGRPARQVASDILDRLRSERP